MKTFIKKILFYSAVIYLANLALGFGLKELGPVYSDAAYGQVKWEDFRSLEPNSIDLLFLGSSHFLSGIDPAVVDSVSGMNSYNMARVGLRPSSAYVLMQEVLQKHRPKYLVLDIFYRTFIGSGYNHLYDFGYVEYDSSKVEFALDNFSFEENARLLFPTYLYRSNFPKLRPLLGLKTKKDNWEELHYKGYIQHPETVGMAALQQNEFMNYHFDESSVDQTSLGYLEKLVKLCKEQGIQMIWVTTPIPDVCLQDIQNPEEIDQYFTSLAKQYEVPYFNYNHEPLRNPLALSDLTDYSDDDHLNINGAKKMSADLAQRLEARIGASSMDSSSYERLVFTP